MGYNEIKDDGACALAQVSASIFWYVCSMPGNAFGSSVQQV